MWSMFQFIVFIAFVRSFHFHLNKHLLEVRYFFPRFFHHKKWFQYLYFKRINFQSNFLYGHQRKSHWLRSSEIKRKEAGEWERYNYYSLFIWKKNSFCFFFLATLVSGTSQGRKTCYRAHAGIRCSVNRLVFSPLPLHE